MGLFTNSKMAWVGYIPTIKHKARRRLLLNTNSIGLAKIITSRFEIS